MNSKLALTALTAAVALPGVAFAEDGVSPGLFTANNIWMMIFSL